MARNQLTPQNSLYPSCDARTVNTSVVHFAAYNNTKLIIIIITKCFQSCTLHVCDDIDEHKHTGVQKNHLSVIPDQRCGEQSHAGLDRPSLILNSAISEFIENN